MSNLRFLITPVHRSDGGALRLSFSNKAGRSRAFVHREDERSENLRKLGAEVVVGDLLEFALSATPSRA